MQLPDVPQEATPEELAAQLRQALAQRRSVEQPLPGGGALYLDRPLPFLCVHRSTSEASEDKTAAGLVTGQAAYLVAPLSPEAEAQTSALVATLGREMAAAFGAFVAVEVWSVSAEDEANPAAGRPHFRIFAPEVPALAGTLDALEEALSDVRVQGLPAHVERAETSEPTPPGAPPLPSAPDVSGPDGPPRYLIGLEVAAVYHDAATGAFFPFLFEALRRALSEALKEALYRFACAQTSLEPPHPLALGPSRLGEAVLDVDRRLAKIDASLRFLLQITPVNTQVAWEAFRDAGFEEEPSFRYRPLPIDPERLKRTLFNVPVERVADPSLAWLFQEKQEELDRKITMLRDRGTRAFFFESLGLFGEVRGELLRLAREVLERLPEHDYDLGAARHYDAAEFADVAAAEFAHYRRALPDFPQTAQIRTDLPAGLMVSQGRLLIGHGTRIPASRIDALLQHEVGTHMVTYFNGRAQPLRLLASGLAGYEALQEGLAVLAEFFAGGLHVPRLRVLAARVLAAHDLVEGASFLDVFRRLHREHAFPPELAFSIAMRTFRGGGVIKDIIYLRGLHELMGHLRNGGTLEPLFIGKLALHHLPVLEELRARGILRVMPLRPRFLDQPETAGKLERVRAGLTFVDLLARRVEA